jgi:hypothetical protein
MVMMLAVQSVGRTVSKCALSGARADGVHKSPPPFMTSLRTAERLHYVTDLISNLTLKFYGTNSINRCTGPMALLMAISSNKTT